MFKIAKPFFINVITPLHAGSGQEAGFVDMPIQREKHTNYPKIEGSSLKGSIREVFSELDSVKKEDINTIFGPENTDNSSSDFASAIGFTDARILLFPVKSVKGVFAYVTCPDIIDNFLNTISISKTTLPSKVSANTITSNSKLTFDNSKVMLEEYLFDVKSDSNTDALADFLLNATGVKEIKNKLIVLEDDAFRDFVSMYTEIITRTKIDSKTGTVENGALFTEEYLPAETILYSLVLASPTHKKDDNKDADNVINFFSENIPEVIQIGGNATTGKGIVSIKIL